MGNFADKIGWALGAVILFIVFLVIGRVRIGRSSGRAPKWQHPADRRAQSQKPDKRVRPGRLSWGRRSRGGGERKRGKAEGGKPEKREHDKREGGKER